jgi:hypothetical protein
MCAQNVVMRFFTAAALLHFGGGALAFDCTRPCISGVRSLFPRARNPALMVNDHDDWWAQRRARQTEAAKNWQVHAAAYNTGSAMDRYAARAARAEAAKVAAASAAEAAARGEISPGTLPLDQDFRWTNFMMSDPHSDWTPPPSSNVGRVLTHFVQSEYARKLFAFRRVPETDKGQIRGMFSEVQLVGTTLELRPRQECANVEGMFDRLAPYLRARLPELQQIHELQKDGMNLH